MICPNCGTSNIQGAAFCANCGKPLASQTDAKVQTDIHTGATPSNNGAPVPSASPTVSTPAAVSDATTPFAPNATPAVHAVPAYQHTQSMPNPVQPFQAPSVSPMPQRSAQSPKDREQIGTALSILQGIGGVSSATAVLAASISLGGLSLSIPHLKNLATTIMYAVMDSMGYDSSSDMMFNPNTALSGVSTAVMFYQIFSIIGAVGIGAYFVLYVMRIKWSQIVLAVSSASIAAASVIVLVMASNISSFIAQAIQMSQSSGSSQAAMISGVFSSFVTVSTSTWIALVVSVATAIIAILRLVVVRQPQVAQVVHPQQPAQVR